MFNYTEADLQHLLAKVETTASEQLEDETVEFKEYRDIAALHNAKDLAEELCALANLKGGVLIVGVRDSSHIAQQRWLDQLVGFPCVDVLETKARIEGKLRNNRPLRVGEAYFRGKNFLVIAVDRRLDSLVSTTSGKFYIRDGRSSRPMTPDEVTSAVKLLTTYDWSAQVVDGDPSELLDPASTGAASRDFQSRRQLQVPPGREAYLEAVGVTSNGRLLNGGLLWLGSESAIKQHLGLYEFRFTWKRPNGQLVLNDVWSGNLWQAVQRARRHFRACNTIHDFDVDGKRFQAPLLDSTAFHEAYLNGLVHRDYACDGMVSVNYTGSKVIITSPGLFYGGVNAENIARHEPRHRNKALAKILMAHHLVDRAGMGILRMSLGSLRYGRSLPRFGEVHDSVEVSMQAEFLRPGIAVLSLGDPNLSLVDLLILNLLYESGHAPVQVVEHRLRAIQDDPWTRIKESAERLPQVEICGTNQGVYLRVQREWRKLLKVSKDFRTTATSAKHVKLYDFLKHHGEATNAEVSELLDHNHSSQTSRFLREAKYVARSGSGPKARWRLNIPGATGG